MKPIFTRDVFATTGRMATSPMPQSNEDIRERLDSAEERLDEIQLKTRSTAQKPIFWKRLRDFIKEIIPTVRVLLSIVNVVIGFKAEHRRYQAKFS